MDTKAIDSQIIGESVLYEIYTSAVLGKGTCSVVYLGRCLDEKMCKTIGKDSDYVAIKRLPVKNIFSDEYKCISTEISIMRSIMENPHSNIIKCYDIIDTSDYIYIVLEYCDSGNMTQLTRSGVKEDKALYYLKQLLEALRYLDEQKILHRDLKPDNILLIDDLSTVKLCDFGLAKKRELHRVTTVCGSPLYMAPEIFKGDYNENVNIWSLGMIFYELIFGTHPYRKCKDTEELRGMMCKKINIPKKGISVECHDLLSKMLEPSSITRISLEEILEHPFVKNTLSDDSEDDSSTESDSDDTYYKNDEMFIMDN
jgi:serine/threonine protein kinase